MEEDFSFKEFLKKYWPVGAVVGAVAIGGFILHKLASNGTSIKYKRCPEPPPSPEPLPPFTEVDQEILEEITDHFIAEKGLDLKKHFHHRFAANFVYSRASIIGGYNPNLIQEPGYLALKEEIRKEYEEVEAYVIEKLREYNNPPSEVLDLEDLAKTSVSQRRRSIRRKARRYTKNRKIRIVKIIWRAASLHARLWTGPLNTTTHEFRIDAMEKLLDRRLRTVERMNYNVASVGAMGRRKWKLEGAGPHGPWNDGFRVRMFEYARIYNSRVRRIIGEERILTIAEKEAGELPTNEHEWEEGRIGIRNRTRLEYLVFPGTRVPFSVNAPEKGLSKHWRALGAAGYFLEMTPKDGVTPAQIIDRMFQMELLNFWQRSWLFCDHVIASIFIEALLYSIRRSENSDATFNKLPEQGSKLALTAWSGTRAPGYLMTSPFDDKIPPYFDNWCLPSNELQIGDHIIFFNSLVYNLISQGDWRLEHSLVMNLDYDDSGAFDMKNLRLQGHGTRVKVYKKFKGVIASKLREAIRDVREHIRGVILNNPEQVDIIRWISATLVRWSPYETITKVRNWRSGSRYLDLGAWWIKIPIDDRTRQIFGVDWETVQDALDAIPKSIADQSLAGQPGVGEGYHPPPDSNAVYFPIFEPRMKDGWKGYLKKRKENPGFQPPKLETVGISGSIMPGLFKNGIGEPIMVVRPQVEREP